MKIYFIRHAPTAMNLTGEMALNYETATIIGNDRDAWMEKMGDLLPKMTINVPICSSSALRCRQTSEMLFNRAPDLNVRELREFDCKDLGGMKFWEVTQEEFENRVKLRATDMERQIDAMFKMFNALNNTFKDINNVICISHGMVIRYIYHYLNGNKNITPYEIINSKGFAFANLDMLVYDTVENTILVRNYKDPIKHG